MTISMLFIRILYCLISIIFSASFAMQNFTGEPLFVRLSMGLLGGLLLSGILVAIDLGVKRFNLRSFNTAMLGLFFGYVMAQAILMIFDGIVGHEVASTSYMPLRFFIFLIASYLGMTMTARAAGEIHASIPFIEFKQTTFKKKDILIDTSILNDSRIIDLASTGLLDHHLIMPKFAFKELQNLVETGEEVAKAKARRCLEVLKKLETIPSLDLRFVDTDFPEIKDSMAKLVQIARFLDTNIITSDINRIQQSSIEAVRIINIHMLSHALKPITQAGESISIKIQRYGKEARQGVGYLDDGTMVVVNGGAEFIGETIKAYVLSVKHTSSGRMIFCNAAEDGSLLGHTDQDDDFLPLMTELDDESNKNFLSL